jgi:hypothetical protein
MAIWCFARIRDNDRDLVSPGRGLASAALPNTRSAKSGTVEISAGLSFKYSQNSKIIIGANG